MVYLAFNSIAADALNQTKLIESQVSQNILP